MPSSSKSSVLSRGGGGGWYWCRGIIAKSHCRSVKIEEEERKERDNKQWWSYKQWWSECRQKRFMRSRDATRRRNYFDHPPYSTWQTILQFMSMTRLQFMSMARPVGVVLNNIYWNVWSITQFYIRNSCFHRAALKLSLWPHFKTWMLDWFFGARLAFQNIWFLCNFEFVEKSRAGGLSTKFYCFLHLLFLTRDNGMYFQKITKKYTYKFRVEYILVGYEKNLSRENLVLKCENHFFLTAQFTGYVVPRKARVFACNRLIFI
jgi:hypothetical protein